MIAALHRKLALIFATVVEGNYVPRQPVTPDGVRTTLRHLLAASRTLDSGSYVTLRKTWMAQMSIEQRGFSMICSTHGKGSMDDYLMYPEISVVFYYSDTQEHFEAVDIRCCVLKRKCTDHHLNHEKILSKKVRQVYLTTVHTQLKLHSMRMQVGTMTVNKW